MSRELPPEDMDLAIRWLDGELAGDERDRFELRLAGEPELARSVEGLALTDDWMRSHARDQARPVGRVLRGLLAVAALAAAVLLVFALRMLVDDGHPRPTHPTRIECRVAVVESFESEREFADQHPELAGLRPLGFEELRGETGANGEAAANVEPREFMARAEGVLQSIQDDTASDVRAGYFALPIAVPDDARFSEVVVVAVPEVGRELLLVPEDAPFGGLVLEPGSHWLPRSPFELATAADGTESVSYSPGFLVPVGARSLSVLVAARPAHFETVGRGDLRRELREVETQATAVARWKSQLESAGFTVSELTVREP